jgi:REP element-mobilizing transposase RayT
MLIPKCPQASIVTSIAATCISSRSVVTAGCPILVAQRPEVCLSRRWSAFGRAIGSAVIGYVVMPEHVHLLVNEPGRSTLDRVIKSIKLSVALRRPERPLWQARYYDFNVWTQRKQVEKLRYMHRNPVVRGLVEKPEDRAWSSFRHYAIGMEGTVEIESFWTGWRREHGGLSSQVPKSEGPGAPQITGQIGR